MRNRAHEIFVHLQRDLRERSSRTEATELLRSFGDILPSDVKSLESLACWLPAATCDTADPSSFTHRDAAVAVLVQAAKGQDTTARLAQSVLLLAFRQRLRSIAIRLTLWLRAEGASADETAEVDAVVIAAFVDAVRALRPERGERAPATLVRNARRRALKSLRRDLRWRSETRCASSDDEFDALVDAGALTPAAPLGAQPERIAAERCLAKWGPDAALLVATELVGLDLTEVSAATGTPVDTLYKRVERLRARARKSQAACQESGRPGACGSAEVLVH